MDIVVFRFSQLVYITNSLSHEHYYCDSSNHRLLHLKTAININSTSLNDGNEEHRINQRSFMSITHAQRTLTSK